MAKKKMNYGNKDHLTSSDLDMKNAKIRITTMIDFSVYEALKSEAESMGIGYQTLINTLLKSHTGAGLSPFENLLKEMKAISKRVEKIEKNKSA